MEPQHRPECGKDIFRCTYRLSTLVPSFEGDRGLLHRRRFPTTDFRSTGAETRPSLAQAACSALVSARERHSQLPLSAKTHDTNVLARVGRVRRILRILHRARQT